MPKSWIDHKAELDLEDALQLRQPPSDTIGGNSGSPVLNRDGELVGINFDRNRHGLVRNFVYTDVQARHVSVHCRAVLEALRERCMVRSELLKELTERNREGSVFSVQCSESSVFRLALTHLNTEH